MYTVIRDPNGFQIQPLDIDTEQKFWGAFGHSQTEWSANWLVRFCQDHRGWHPFTSAELAAFRRKHVSEDHFPFNRLLQESWIQQDGDGLYHFTFEFVLACYRSSPASSKDQTPSPEVAV